MPTPSLLIVPYRSKTGRLYSQIPVPVAPATSGAGDFNVTRATIATRFGSDGLIASVASGIPRLDYYTSGGTVGCPALLVEPSAANGILNSTDTTTSWTLGANLTSGTIDVIGVSGNNISIAVSGSSIGSAAGRFVRFSNNVALASGSTYTISFLIKKTASHTIGGYQLTMSSGVIGSGFDVSGSFASGSNVDTAPTTNRTRRIERWGTDVFRCIETFTMTAAATGTHLAFGPVGAVTVSTNSAVGTQLGFAAPQLELGSVATSFIPTTTGSVTRNADVISVSGAVSGSIGQTEGTMYVEVDLRTFANVGAFATISDGTGTNLLMIYKFTDGKIYFDRISATQSALTSPGSALTYTAPTILKIAVGYKSGDTRMYINGVAATAQQTQTFTFGTLTKVNIGSTRNDASFLNDRIRAAALYTTRLTNAELATLTSP